MNPSLRFAFDEIRRVFDEIQRRFDESDARMERCLSRALAAVEPRGAAVELCIGGPKQFGATQLIVADNWGGLFDPVASGSSSPPPMKEQDAFADNWGGLFEPTASGSSSPAPTKEQGALDARIVPDNWGGEFAELTRVEEHGYELAASDAASPLSVKEQLALNAVATEEIESEKYPYQIQELEAKRQVANNTTIESALSKRETGMRALDEPLGLLVTLFVSGLDDVFGFELSTGRGPFRLPGDASKFRLELPVSEDRDSSAQGVVSAPQPPRLRQLRVAPPRPPRLRRPRRVPPHPPWLCRPRRAPPCRGGCRLLRPPPRPPWLRPDLPPPSRSSWPLCSLPPAAGPPSQATKLLPLPGNEELLVAIAQFNASQLLHERSYASVLVFESLVYAVPFLKANAAAAAGVSEIRSNYASGCWWVRAEDAASAMATAYICCGLVVAAPESAERIFVEFGPSDQHLAGSIYQVSMYGCGKAFRGKDVRVIGCGNSRMGFCLVLCNHSILPSMVVRSMVYALQLEVHANPGALQVFEVLSLHADIFCNIYIVLELLRHTFMGVHQYQPWPPPLDELRLLSCDVVLRPLPWPSFNMVESCSVRCCGRLWKPPWFSFRYCQAVVKKHGIAIAGFLIFGGFWFRPCIPIVLLRLEFLHENWSCGVCLELALIHITEDYFQAGCLSADPVISMLLCGDERLHKILLDYYTSRKLGKKC